LANPLILTEERLSTPMGGLRDIKEYIRTFIDLMKEQKMQAFLNAKSKAFVGSGSALAFTMFYHSRDDRIVFH